MVVQLHLALVAAIDARLMVLDEPTLGLDVLSRKAFYEMLIDEWCDGERSVLISTHQVEEVEVAAVGRADAQRGQDGAQHPAGRGGRALRGPEPRPAAADAVAAAHPCCATAAGPVGRAVRRRAAARGGRALGQRNCGPAWWTCSSR
jgi:ABC-2 type transport system ATP-binding protein